MPNDKIILIKKEDDTRYISHQQARARLRADFVVVQDSEESFRFLKNRKGPNGIVVNCEEALRICLE